MIVIYSCYIHKEEQSRLFSTLYRRAIFEHPKSNTGLLLFWFLKKMFLCIVLVVLELTL